MPFNSTSKESGFLARQSEQVNRTERRVDELHKRSSVGPWIPATLLNDYANFGTPYADLSYRLVGDQLQMRGVIDTTAATSGTVAFTLIATCRPSHDVSFLADMATSATTFDVARVHIDSDTGDVTLYW